MSRHSFLLFTALLTGCAATPVPYDGVKGYQLENSDKGLSVIYTDEAEQGKDHFTALIASVCSSETGHEVFPESLAVTNDISGEKQIELMVRVPSTTFSAQDSLSGEWKVNTSYHEQTVFNNIKFRQITALCPGASA